MTPATSIQAAAPHQRAGLRNSTSKITSQPAAVRVRPTHTAGVAVQVTAMSCWPARTSKARMPQFTDRAVPRDAVPVTCEAGREAMEDHCSAIMAVSRYVAASYPSLAGVTAMLADGSALLCSV